MQGYAVEWNVLKTSIVLTRRTAKSYREVKEKAEQEKSVWQGRGREKEKEGEGRRRGGEVDVFLGRAG